MAVITRLNDPKTSRDADIRTKEEFKNLVKQLPSEATAIYLTGISYFQDSTSGLSFAAISGLGMLILVRARAKVSKTIWLTSIIGYIIWIYALGDGPIQAGLKMIGWNPHPQLGAFFAAVYIVVVGYLALKPPQGG